MKQDHKTRWVRVFRKTHRMEISRVLNSFFPFLFFVSNQKEAESWLRPLFPVRDWSNDVMKMKGTRRERDTNWFPWIIIHFDRPFATSRNNIQSWHYSLYSTTERDTLWTSWEDEITFIQYWERIDFGLVRNYFSCSRWIDAEWCLLNLFV